MNKKEIEDLLNEIKDNIPIEEYRSEGTSDGLCHYELDNYSWQYKTLEYINNLQQRIDKAIEYMKFIENDKTDKYIPIKDYDEYEILLSILKGENNE